MTAMADSGGGGGTGMLRFAAHAIRGRWFMVFASFLIMSMAGATYLFGVYSKDIKKSLGYDQETLNLLGSAKDLGAGMGIPSGILAEFTPTWFVLLVGAAMNFVGYFMIWLSVTGKVAKPQVWQMCLYIAIGANSQNFANTGSLVTCVKNFPESRGIMLGLLKGYVGLSGAIMTQLYLAVYGNDSTSLILLIGWLPAVISIFFVYTIRAIKVVRQPNERKIFYQFLYISILLALFLMCISIVQKQTTFSHAGYVATSTVVCIILFVPLTVALKEEYSVWKTKQQPVDPPNKITVEKPAIVESKLVPLPPTESSKVGDSTKTGWFANIFRKPDRGEDYTVFQALSSVDMLLIFIATFAGFGTSLTAIDNLGQIGEAFGYPTQTIKTFTSLVSIWNYSGRVFAGFVSEELLTRRGFPRTLMWTLCLIASCVGYLLIAFKIPAALYIASIIIGFSYGAQLTLLFAVISELFGLKCYSTLFNWGQLASPIGSYVFNVKVTGVLYDNVGLKQLALKGLTRKPGEEVTCMGAECFRLSFIILASVTAFAALVSFVLVLRTRAFYKSDIYKKFREEEKEGATAMALSRSNSL